MMKKENKTHGVQLLIRCVVRDPDGKIVTDTGRKPAKSFVLQFLDFIHGLFYITGASEKDAKDVNNVTDRFVRGFSACASHFYADAGINDSSHGVVIGTGDTAETNIDYKLETQLTEGVGAGNITHGTTVVDSAGEVGANVDMEIKRAFINNTGSAITVKEAGVYVKGMAGNAFCIIRDVLLASVDVSISKDAVH
ncbi:unnamed protein product [marine sediment metagenome]|uniref:Uncharacterized protein n=1 Tax=marine sediment metagenome TaxID=412755 RepID=X1C109_9ZZZZ